MRIRIVSAFAGFLPLIEILSLHGFRNLSEGAPRYAPKI
jgi:hypothetical protein